MDELEQRIPYEKKILFYYEPPYGNVPEEETREYMNIEECTGIDKKNWDKMTRDEQDSELNDALREWISDKIDYGWDAED